MAVKGIEGFGHVKFVSYTGKFPCLCEGVLTLLIDGEKVTFGNKYRNKVDYTSFWRSGGRIDNDYNAHYGEWIINEKWLPEKYRKYAIEIGLEFNENVEYGCCGGCI